LEKNPVLALEQDFPVIQAAGKQHQPEGLEVVLGTQSAGAPGGLRFDFHDAVGRLHGKTSHHKCRPENGVGKEG
jgi:hypothetical protein